MKQMILNISINKKSINLIGGKGIFKGMITGIKFIMKINEVNEVPNKINNT